MTARILKILTILAVATLATGCKLAVMVPSGGDVTSASGTRNCTGGSLCEFAITETSFSESFTATPRPGYQFVRWQKGTDFLCGDSTNPTCTVTLSGNAILDEAIIALFNRDFIMPVFKDVGFDTDGDGVRNELDEDDDNDGTLDDDDPCPLDPANTCVLITETISVAGKEWAQPDLFRGNSWNDINAVCPGGACVDGGVLNGFDMTGWTWASREDIRALFNFHVGSLVLVGGPGDPEYHQVDSIWAPAFFNAGWRPTHTAVVEGFLQKSITGFMRDPLLVEYPYAYYGGCWDQRPGQVDVLYTGSPDTPTNRNPYNGSWFYR